MQSYFHLIFCLILVKVIPLEIRKNVKIKNKQENAGMKIKEVFMDVIKQQGKNYFI
jgi:hypothetical protein